MAYKKQKSSRNNCVHGGRDFFEALPDDLVFSILCKLASSVSSPSDFVTILLTCKRLNQLALHRIVVSKASKNMFNIRAANWSESALRFVTRCVSAGNVDASFFLGMIRFYCLGNRTNGTSLIAKAAIKSHAPALYSLSVMQFNGSGVTKNEKNLPAGVALCTQAALLGYIDALRELGHCFQDGYGVSQNVTKGRHLLIRANAHELASSLRTMSTWQIRYYLQQMQCNQMQPSEVKCTLLSDFGCHVPEREMHPVNVFLKEWFGSGRGVLEDGLRMCSYEGCGRPETRAHEFRRCSVCGKVNYCSRACQALDWRVRHKAECVANENEPRGYHDMGGLGVV